MSKFRLIALACSIIAVAVFMRPAQSQTGFVVENADNRRDVSTSFDNGLTTGLTGVTQRFLLEHANVRRDVAVAGLPAAMQTAVNQVVARILLEQANVKRDIGIAGPPASLATALNAIVPRFLIEQANVRRDFVLGYPHDLINDRTPPQQPTDLTTAPEPDGTRLRFATNEFTRCTISFGFQPSVYTESITQDLFAKQHDVLLPSIPAGATLYFQITITDLGGNQITSGEQVVKGIIYLYLPSIRKR